MARRQITVVVVCYLLAVVASAGAIGCAADSVDTQDEELASEPTSQSIINGQAASAFTEAALVNGNGYICSGAVIAPRVALTAGHCVSGTSWTIVAPYANKQSARGTKKWTEYVSTGKSVNPKTNDVAVIILDTPIKLATYPKLADKAVPAGTQAVNVGRIRNGQASNTQLFFGKPVTVRPAAGFPFSYGSGLIIQSGDSGGPVYAGTGANRTIIAVNSGAGGSTQVLARVDLAFKKIQQIIAANGGTGAPPTKATTAEETDEAPAADDAAAAAE